MDNNETTTTDETPAKKGWKSKIVKWVVILGIPFTIGMAVGGGDESATAEPEVRTITKEVPGETITKEVEVQVPGPEVEVTPQSCLDALDYAESAMSLAGDSAAVASDAITAAVEYDLASMEQVVIDLQAINGDLEPLVPLYLDSSAACRSGAN